MSKSLAELRQSARTSLPERSYEMCLSQALVAETQALEQEKQNLGIAAQRRNDDGEPAGPARKLGEGSSPRITEINARLETLYDEMREHTGQLLLRGVTAGEWRRWADAHPPREDGRDDRGRPVTLAVDEQIALGYCDASALMGTLGTYAAEWNGKPLETGDWDWLEEHAAPGDLKAIAQVIVVMHEGPGAKPLPKESKTSSETLLSKPA